MRKLGRVTNAAVTWRNLESVMDIIKSFMVCNNSAVVSVMDTTATVEEARRRHDLSPTATVALGKLLTIGAFITSKFKHKDANMSITLDGGGGLGKLTVAGSAGGAVRGFVQNPRFECGAEDGVLKEAEAVGNRGFLTVVADLKMKEPYSGTVALKTGEICNDFAYYFTESEQQPSAVSASVLLDSEGVVSAGGVFMQLLPNCPDCIVTVLEDVMTNFGSPASLIREKGVDGIIADLFSHMISSEITEAHPCFRCSCSQAKVNGVVRSLDDKECAEILAERGKITVHCSFCNTDYVYDADAVAALKSAK